MKKLLLALLLLASPAQAQDGTNHSMPVFGGAGFSGFREAGPCIANQALTWAGVSFDPACQSIPGLGTPVTVPQGGTGLATLTNHGILVGQGTSPVAFVGPCTLGFFVGGTGASADPTCQGFLNLSTGATTRTWQTKIQELVYSIKDYGALCDGSTDDATAIQNAVNAAQSTNGVVFVPASTTGCKVNTTISITSGQVTIRGVHLLGSTIFTNNDVKLLSIGGGRHSVEDIQLLGVGIVGGNGPAAGGNSHVLHFTSTCVDCYAHRLYIVGGFYGFLDDGVDTIMEEIIVNNNYNTSVRKTSNALWMIRSKIDNPWPMGGPAFGSSVAAWAATTAYNVGDVRLHPSGFYMQVRLAGTSGGAAPTLQNYGTDIVDGAGTLRWRLATQQNSAALQLTTGANEVHIFQSDFTGAQGRAAVLLDNDGAGTAPFAVAIVGGVISQAINGGIRALAGAGLTVTGGAELGGCVVTGCSAIEFGGSWVGDVSITNVYGIGNATNGIRIGTGVNTVISGNALFGFTNGIDVAPAVTKFTITGNAVGSSPKWGANTIGILIEAGASTNYVILGNTTNGAGTGVTDGGTGTLKTVQNAEGQILIGTYVQTAPVAVAALPTCNAGLDGARAAVNNSNAVSFTAGIGAVVAGGGTLHVPVFCDGASWRIG